MTKEGRKYRRISRGTSRLGHLYSSEEGETLRGHELEPSANEDLHRAGEGNTAFKSVEVPSPSSAGVGREFEKGGASSCVVLIS
ncbi:hypothetical protein TNCV_361231 [Trichonephila clavipes]|nr:hypothetical protein TNCV_361231 [Trichonephila clavipes]